MTPTAFSRSVLTNRVTKVEKATREDAAAYLSVLVEQNGWVGDAVRVLLNGERIQHRGHEYWIE